MTADLRAEANEYFLLESFGGAKTYWNVDNYLSELLNEQSQKYLSFDKDSKLQAFVFYRIIDKELWIMHFAVKQKGIGMGKRFLLKFLTQLKPENVDSVGLEVAVDNVAALALYKRFGFEEMGKRKNYYGAGKDALMLRRIL